MASMASPEMQSSEPDPGLEAPIRPRRAMESGWVWMAIACTLVGVSGLARSYQSREVSLVKSSTPPSPFPLETLPTRIGDWTSLSEADVKLDPLTVRITGSTDHIQRTYRNELTGVSLAVLVLYGPAEPVAPHTPEACYPATGYGPEEGPAEVKIPVGAEQARFRQCIYTKAGSGHLERANVYYSFRMEGAWGPDIADGKRLHRSSAGIIKVQIQRVMGPREVSKPENEPVVAFLSALIPEIESRVAGADARTARTASR